MPTLDDYDPAEDELVKLEPCKAFVAAEADQYWIYLPITPNKPLLRLVWEEFPISIYEACSLLLRIHEAAPLDFLVFGELVQFRGPHNVYRATCCPKVGYVFARTRSNGASVRSTKFSPLLDNVPSALAVFMEFTAT